ncbi:MAG TPA: hypothetical protein VNN25_19110 [Thermoanaerobaculia bacterium]|nr:hypothetical protein [Thermoanaerobaculia bacterium]
MERIRGRCAVLPARNPDLPILHVVELEQPCFAPSQPVPVDEIEEQEVACLSLRNRVEEALNLLSREVLDRFLLAASFIRHSVMSLRTGSDSDTFPHLRSVGRQAEEEDASQPAS